MNPPDRLRSAGSLLGGGTVVRVAADGAPWPGVIVREDDGRSTLHVDAALLAGSEVWRAPTGGHLLAPTDVVRTATGHEAVFDLCRGRLDVLLHQRDRVRAPLTAGEAVTVAVSLLRGTEEAGAEAPGKWWIAEDGRPVLALTGDENAATETRNLLSELAASSADPVLSTALHAAHDAIGGNASAIMQAEDLLFAAAEPAALITSVPAPAAARSVAAAVDHAAAPSRSALRAAVARHVDADVADRVLRARDDVRVWWTRRRSEPRVRRPRQRRRRDAPGAGSAAAAGVGAEPPASARAAARPRRRPALIGVAVAAAVLTAGMMWPEQSAPPAAPTGQAIDARPSPSPTPGSPGTATGPPPALESPGAQPDADAAAQAASGSADAAGAEDARAAEDPEQRGRTLLDAASACGDEACLNRLRETPGRPVIDGILAERPEERRITLVDDYGGVAVLRVSPSVPGAQPDRLLVIVEVERKWLIRDAYDVADQP